MRRARERSPALRRDTLTSTLLAAALVAPLAVYAWVGSYSRYTADDYCWAGVLREQGFLNAQAWWYWQYSPRYAFTFVVNLVELAGPGIAPVLPMLAIVVWVAVLTWTLRQFEMRYALAVALTITVATLATAPDLPQSLYWQTGMLTYLLPLILATFLVGWVKRGQTGWASLLVCAVVTFVAGGLAEAYLIPQNVALTLALGVALLARQRVTASLLGAALAGGVLALLTILVAPATASRVGGSPADLWLALSASVATAAFQAGRFVRSFLPLLALCLFVPAVLSGERKRDWRQVAVVTAVVAVVLPFCYFPSFFAQNGNPPARSLIVPGLILVAYAVYLGWAVVPRVHSAVLVVLAVVPLAVAVTNAPEIARAAEYATLWDARDTQIRAARQAGQTQVQVEPLPRNLGEAWVTPDPEHFFNRCVARYYGLEAIAATGAVP